MRKKRTRKERRHSGRKTPNMHFDGMNKKEVIFNALEPQIYWNDWEDYRDGFRGCDDRKQMRNAKMYWALGFEVERWNRKLKRLIFRRKIIKLVNKHKGAYNG